MGALSDSFYEYLFKLWLYKSKRDRPLLNTYVKAMDAVKKKIIKKSRSGLLYTGDYTSSGGLMPQMEHLACFSDGLFALTSSEVSASRLFWPSSPKCVRSPIRTQLQVSDQVK